MRRRGCQHGRALEEGGGHGQTTPRLRPRGCPLEVGGNVFVRQGGRLGQVPCAPVGVDLRVGRLGERQMHSSPFGTRRRPVHR